MSMSPDYENLESLFYNTKIHNNAEISIPSKLDSTLYNDLICNHSAIGVEGNGDFKLLDFVLVRDGIYSVGVEAFKVDGAINKKGSINDKQRNTFVTNFKRASIENNGSYSKGETFEYIFSLENYIKNFKKIFLEHYKKIDLYKSTFEQFAKSTGKSKKTNMIGFLIVDDFFSPVIYEENGMNKYFSPHLVKELLTFLLEHSKVDFILIYYNKAIERPNSYFINNSKESIMDIIRSNVLIDKDTVFSVAPAKHVYASLKDELKVEAKIEVSYHEGETHTNNDKSNN